MASENQNPQDSLKVSSEAPDQHRVRPTCLSLFSGYFGSLILILVLSAIVGTLFFLRLLAHHPYPWSFVPWLDMDRSEYRSLSLGAAITIGGSILYGIWIWFTGIFEEIRTRRDLEHHARNSQANAGNTPLGKLLDQREKEE